MSIPLSPGELIRWTMRTTGAAASVPGRVLDLLSAAESVVARADELVRRTEKVVAGAEKSVAHAEQVTKAAEEQVAATRPLIEFLEEFSAHEIQAAIRLVDELPRLSAHLRVGPDMHELLDVAKDVRQAIQGIPGFEYLRRRGEDKDGDKD